VNEIPPQLQNQIQQLQQLQRQIQTLAVQRNQLEVQLRELEGTLEELAKVQDDTPMYRAVGSLLVKVDDKEAVRKELEERKETVSIRVTAVKKQEKSFGERFEELSQKVQAAIGGGAGASQPAG
jgi:prefoldin beta subunit